MTNQKIFAGMDGLVMKNGPSTEDQQDQVLEKVAATQNKLQILFVLAIVVMVLVLFLLLMQVIYIIYKWRTQKSAKNIAPTQIVIKNDKPKTDSKKREKRKSSRSSRSKQSSKKVEKKPSHSKCNKDKKVLPSKDAMVDVDFEDIGEKSKKVVQKPPTVTLAMDAPPTYEASQKSASNVASNKSSVDSAKESSQKHQKEDQKGEKNPNEQIMAELATSTPIASNTNVSTMTPTVLNTQKTQSMTSSAIPVTPEKPVVDPNATTSPVVSTPPTAVPQAIPSALPIPPVPAAAAPFIGSKPSEEKRVDKVPSAADITAATVPKVPSASTNVAVPAMADVPSAPVATTPTVPPTSVPVPAPTTPPQPAVAPPPAAAPAVPSTNPAVTATDSATPASVIPSPVAVTPPGLPVAPSNQGPTISDVEDRPPSVYAMDTSIPKPKKTSVYLMPTGNPSTSKRSSKTSKKTNSRGRKKNLSR